MRTTNMKAREQAGLPDDLVLYCARHGFGTEMYRETKNLFAVNEGDGTHGGLDEDEVSTPGL